MKNLIMICAVAAMMVFTGSVAYALPSDDFNDDSMDTNLWILFEEDHANAWLDEIHARLEMRSTGAAEAAAVYTPNAWGFDPAYDFSFKVDFHCAPASALGTANVLLGVGKGPDDNAQISAGYYGPDGGDSFFHCQYVVGGSESEYETEPRTPDGGTLYISYDASEDDLYLSDTGYWSG